MKIYLIRHGETTGDVEDRYGGDYDDHLTDRGIRQSKELAKELLGKNIKIIYHSPRIRAIETARIVSETLDVKLEVVFDLRERNNYGVLTGLTKKEAKQKHPQEVEELSKGTNHHVTGSEDYESFKKRVIKEFEKITDDSRYDTIAIITHGGPIRCIFREILKLPAPNIGDCEIVELEKKDSEISIVK